MDAKYIGMLAVAECILSASAYQLGGARGVIALWVVQIMLMFWWVWGDHG